MLQYVGFKGGLTVMCTYCLLTAAIKLFSVMKVTHSRGSVSELRLFTLWMSLKTKKQCSTYILKKNTSRYVVPFSLTCQSCHPRRRTQSSRGRSRPGGCLSVRSKRCAPNHRLLLRSEMLLQILQTQTAPPQMASCCPREWGRASPPPPLCRQKTPCGIEKLGCTVN